MSHGRSNLQSTGETFVVANLPIAESYLTPNARRTTPSSGCGYLPVLYFGADGEGAVTTGRTPVASPENGRME